MKKLILVALFMGPIVAAATTPLEKTVATFGTLVNQLVPIMIVLAVLVFFWGLVKYIMSASDEAAKEGGKNLMIWGMIALFVMVAFWGILGYFQSTLGLSGTVVSSTPPSIALPSTIAP